MTPCVNPSDALLKRLAGSALLVTGSILVALSNSEGAGSVQVLA